MVMASTEQIERRIFMLIDSGAMDDKNWPKEEVVTRASVGEWGLSRTKVYSGAVGVLRVVMSGSRQGIGRRRDLR